MDPHRPPNREDVRAARILALLLSVQVLSARVGAQGIERDDFRLQVLSGLSEGAVGWALVLLERAGVIERMAPARRGRSPSPFQRTIA